MASQPSRHLSEEERRKEEARRAEEDRIAAEREFLERHERERRLSSSRFPAAGSRGGSATSSMAESESEAEKKKRIRSPDDKDKGKEKKRSKTKRTEDSESDGEEEEEMVDDPLVNLNQVLDKMRGWFKQPTIMKMVSKPQTEKFGRYLNRFQEQLMLAREQRGRLEARIEERAELVKIVQEEIKKGKEEDSPKRATGYADAVARSLPKVPKVTGSKGPVLPPPKLVIVRSDNKESEEVKATLKRLVKPQEIGLKVRRLVNVRHGVMVEAETEEGVNNLMKVKSLSEAGLKVERPTKKRPVVMIYDVNAEM